MKIQKAIGQKRPFRNNRHEVIVNLLFTHSWLLGELRSFFKPFRITEKQYNILRILKGTDKPISTAAIRARLLDKMSDTTRVIDRMIKKNLVLKKTNKIDRRLVDITLSDQGLELLQKIEVHVLDMDNIAINLTEEQANLVSTLLDTMRGDSDEEIKS